MVKFAKNLTELIKLLMSFRFKQFSIEDSDCAQKVGTDGVFVGAWARLEDARQILDVGAGSGLVSLMTAQRSQRQCSRIKAVELDTKAAAQCTENFRLSPWHDRLECLNCDFKEADGVFDLIVSNPPFFCGDLAANTSRRMLARQGVTLNYFTLIEYAAEHLDDLKGRLVFISDMRRESDIVFKAELCRLSLSRICHVYPKPGAEPKRILWEFSKRSIDKPIKEKLVHRNPDGTNHSDYINLNKDFYIGM